MTHTKAVRLAADWTGSRRSNCIAIKAVARNYTRTLAVGIEQPPGLDWIFKCDCSAVFKIDALQVSRWFPRMCVECESADAPSNYSHYPAKKRRAAQGRHALYWCWRGMMARCYTPTSNNYHHYGAQGIKVHRPWHDFQIFAEEVGPRPTRMTLDRINPYGDYMPKNVRWLTRADQNRNTKRAFALQFPKEAKNPPKVPQ